MKRFSLYYIFIFTLLVSCSSIQESVGSKKNNSDEFLVEKKSPLVMPPDFNELPMPNTSETQLEENSSSIKSLITSNEETNVSEQNNETNQNLESSILKKIKNN